MSNGYNKTRIACYIGYFVQAIINNLSPVLFIIYQKELGVSYSLLSLLIIINFITQLVTDVMCIKLTEKFGERKCVVASHVLSFLGLVLLGILPQIMSARFTGLLIATVLSAVGSGMIEVLISPIVSNLPSDNDAGDMSLLHSFYCWGQVAVILVSTLLLAVGTPWYVLPMLWAIIPLINIYSFLIVPIIESKGEHEKLSFKSILKTKSFFAFLVLMLCAGASEMAMSQWASLFVEKSLKLNKAVGDVLGPCMFAAFMGTGRVLFGINGNRISIRKALTVCAFTCALSYFLAALSSEAFVSLLACAMCGLSVSLMWPGVYSICTELYSKGSTAMFAFLALAGDAGCAMGPAIAGFLSDVADCTHLIPLDGLRFGLLCSALFSIVMFVVLIYLKKVLRCKI